MRSTSQRAAAAALAPAAGAATFGFWAGTADGGATAAGAIAGHLLLLAAAVAAAPGWRDPLGLGRRGRLLPWALWLLAAASAWASPVPRAGRVAVVLLPAFLLLPAAVARAWRSEAGRRWGARGVAAVVVATAVWALAGRLAGGDPRAASPLGHHLLLAVWLLALLPVAALPAVRDRGGWRALGVVAGGAGSAAVIASGSLAGWAGLALEAGLAGVVALRRRRRGRGFRLAPATRAAGFVLAALIVLLAALAGPRLLRIGAGDDPSARARSVYVRAGLDGVAERPALGWGPGATPWTLALHLRPVPGVDSPGEVVAELHSLPLQLVYELGWSGLLLAAATGALFVRRRRAGAADSGLGYAGLIGLGGVAVALCATAWLAVTALPVALALAAGAALAGDPAGGVRGARPGVGSGDEPAVSLAAGAGGSPDPSVRAAGSRWPRRIPVLLYCAVAVAVLLPLDLAHLAYDRAVRADEPPARRAALERAVELDPGSPLYRAWRAWEGEGSTPPAAVAEEALRAAEEAHGVGSLWLAAGVYGGSSGAPWAAAALRRACDLDPLGALGPFHLTALDPGAPQAAATAARVLLAEPRLAAATFWEGREELLGAALAEVLAWPGVDPGWREALLAQVNGWDPQVPGDLADLYLKIDPSGADSLLLRSFRRRPHSFLLAPVTLRRGLAEQVTVPPAAALPTTSPVAFAGSGCGPPVDLQTGFRAASEEG